MVLTAAEAGKQVGRSKAAILKAIHEGRLSASRESSGAFTIDPSELFRVYRPVNGQVNGNGAGDGYSSTQEVNEGQQQVRTLRELVNAHEATICDLRNRLDEASATISQLTAVVASLTPKQPVGFWRRLLRG